jgi:hypothetical protein
MSAFLASFVYISRGNLVKLNLVSLDNRGRILAIQPYSQETSRTTFLEGILTAPLELNQALLPNFSTTDTPLTIIQVLKIQMEKHPSWTFLQCLDHCTRSTGLRPGMKTALWCIHGVHPTDKKWSDEIRVEQIISRTLTM